MKTILVTGGAGFIGSNFILYLLEKNKDCRVVNLDALTYAGNPENLRPVESDPRYLFVKGDICDSGLVSNLFKEHDFDSVVHFAAESHVDRSITGPEQFVKTNVLGTQVLLQAAKTNWEGKYERKRFLHISTDEVYGTLGPEGFFREDTPLAPNSPYSASKAGSDLLVRSFFETYGFPSLITRCSNNYGPLQFPEKLIPLTITNALRDLPLPVYGDGKNIRDWLFVKDHCAAVELVLREGVPGRVYNIGGSNEWQNIDIVKLICTELGKPHSLITFVKDRLGHDRRYAIDATRIRTELNWSPSVSFEQGIKETIRWYCENRGWWERLLVR
ncbi:MAG TPA: dTDP-glucose 4,6-dehydratase [Chitinispirillaceae bacterium]|jgi:dTDP-glucose 4,6-dehydratase|nr:dTDP-glucose 4,6-dehydratase [Chitinispirillaceae bacterium]